VTGPTDSAPRSPARHYRGPGVIERRGKSTRLQLYAAGRAYRWTLTTTDLRQVAEFAKARDAELEHVRARHRAGLPGRAPLSALFDKYEAERLPLLAPKAARTYRLCLDAFRAFFVERLGDPYVETIRPGQVHDFLTWRRTWRRPEGDPVSPRTIQKERTVLHTIFAFAELLEWREGNPVARTVAPRVEERTPVILTEDEYQRLLEATRGRPMTALYVRLLAESGLRCESEALFLRWEDVDFEGNFLMVRSGRDGHSTKSRKSRQVPMTPTLRAALKTHFATYRFATYSGQPTPWVFHLTLNRWGHQAGDRIHSLRNSFKAAAKRERLPADFRQHDLRHRRVTTWLAEGHGTALVQEAMGHSSPMVTQRYTHLQSTHLQALVEERSSQKSSQKPSQARREG